MLEQIIIWVVILLILVVIVLTSIISNEEYKIRMKLMIRFKNIGLFLIAILSYISCIVSQSMLILKVYFFMINTISFLLFLYDHFYYNEKKKNYVRELQEKCFKKESLSDLFYIEETNSEYKEYKTYEDQIYSIVVIENQKCIQLKTNRSFIFIPKRTLNDQLLNFICYQLNNGKEEIVTIDDLNTDYLNFYIDEEPSSVYRKIIKFVNFIKKEKIKKIISVIFVIIMLILSIIALVYL